MAKGAITATSQLVCRQKTPLDGERGHENEKQGDTPRSKHSRDVYKGQAHPIISLETRLTRRNESTRVGTRTTTHETKKLQELLTGGATRGRHRNKGTNQDPNHAKKCQQGAIGHQTKQQNETRRKISIKQQQRRGESPLGLSQIQGNYGYSGKFLSKGTQDRNWG